MKTFTLSTIALLLAALLIAPPADARVRRTATPTVTATWVCPPSEYWQPAMNRCWINPTAGPTLAPALIAVTATPTVAWPPADGYPGPQPQPTGYPAP